MIITDTSAIEHTLVIAGVFGKQLIYVHFVPTTSGLFPVILHFIKMSNKDVFKKLVHRTTTKEMYYTEKCVVIW